MVKVEVIFIARIKNSTNFQNIKQISLYMISSNFSKKLRLTYLKSTKSLQGERLLLGIINFQEFLVLILLTLSRYGTGTQERYSSTLSAFLLHLLH